MRDSVPPGVCQRYAAAGHYDLFARVGNIEQPTEGWSDWQPINLGGEAPKFPRARFLQWKAVLHGDATLRQVGFYYLPQNVAPVVDDIVVELHARVVPGLNQESQVTPVQINFPAESTDGIVYEATQTSQPLMAMRTHGWATVRWKAHDDNGDLLGTTPCTIAARMRRIGCRSSRTCHRRISPLI